MNESIRKKLDELANYNGPTITVDSIAPIAHVREPHPLTLSARYTVPPDEPPERCDECAAMCDALYIERRRRLSPPFCKACHLVRLQQRHHAICVWCDKHIKRGELKHQCFLNDEGGPPIVHVCKACGEAGVTYQLVQKHFGEAALYGDIPPPPGEMPVVALAPDEVRAVLASAAEAFDDE